MSYTKTKVVNTDWLHYIDGMSVEKAIEYLQKLNPSHVLSYSLEGDTHGCSVESCLTYEVPMTNKEILAQLEKHYLKEISLYESAKADHTRAGRKGHIESCERNLERLNAKLAEARAKYA
jgi:aspartate/glutamate racemase